MSIIFSYSSFSLFFFFFFFNDTATTEIYTLSLHDALPICCSTASARSTGARIERWNGNHREHIAIVRINHDGRRARDRSEEHTSELQSLAYLVCRLLLEKKKNKHI